MVTDIPVLLTAIGVTIVQRLKAVRWGMEPFTKELRTNWLTPKDVMEKKTKISRGRTLVLGVMRGYFIVVMILSVVSMIQIAHSPI